MRMVIDMRLVAHGAFTLRCNYFFAAAIGTGKPGTFNCTENKCVRVVIALCVARLAYLVQTRCPQQRHNRRR